MQAVGRREERKEGKEEGQLWPYGPKDLQKGCGYGVAGTESEKGPVFPQIG
jgi:hypothetical protein